MAASDRLLMLEKITGYTAIIETARKINVIKAGSWKLVSLTGKTDEDNFGFTYKELDDYILYGKEPSEEKLEKIKRMHAFSAHKRKMPMRYGIE